jgi:hypothetical protein
VVPNFQFPRERRKTKSWVERLALIDGFDSAGRNQACAGAREKKKDADH